MSVFNMAVIVVGVPAQELKSFCVANGISFEDFIEEHDMDTCQPFYDAPTNRCVVGFCASDSGDSDYEEIVMFDVSNEVEKLCKKFEELTGIHAKVYITPHVF